MDDDRGTYPWPDGEYQNERIRDLADQGGATSGIGSQGARERGFRVGRLACRARDAIFGTGDCHRGGCATLVTTTRIIPAERPIAGADSAQEGIGRALADPESRRTDGPWEQAGASRRGYP